MIIACINWLPDKYHKGDPLAKRYGIGVYPLHMASTQFITAAAIQRLVAVLIINNHYVVIDDSCRVLVPK